VKGFTIKSNLFFRENPTEPRLSILNEIEAFDAGSNSALAFLAARGAPGSAEKNGACARLEQAGLEDVPALGSPFLG
jgi:hypothetical protein